jgi:hypothetical protein
MLIRAHEGPTSKKKDKERRIGRGITQVADVLRAKGGVGNDGDVAHGPKAAFKRLKSRVLAAPSLPEGMSPWRTMPETRRTRTSKRRNCPFFNVWLF